MSIWAIIPVKPLKRAKSRLATVLSPEQRYAFACMMLTNVLNVVTQAPEINGVLVVSRDTKALAVAREAGAKTLQESKPASLNPALTRATEVVRAWGAKAALILPADLPFVTQEDISNIIEKGEREASIVIATDRSEDGTNALFMRPVGLIHYEYGSGSYQKHVEAAKSNPIIHLEFYQSKNLLLDIDLPEDLDEYNMIVSSGNYDTLRPFYPNLAP